MLIADRDVEGEDEVKVRVYKEGMGTEYNVETRDRTLKDDIKRDQTKQEERKCKER